MTRHISLGRRSYKLSPGEEALSETPGDIGKKSESPGRPRGSKNRDYVSGERCPGVCPKCKCTESLNESKRILPLPNDREFRFVQLIKCMCKQCGQWRIDRQKCNPALPSDNK